MPQTVVFDGTQHTFPDDFTDTDIAAALSTGPSVAGDVARSVGIGVAKGAVGLAGLPGDIAEMGARGIDRATRFIGDKLGVDVKPREDRVPTYGSADIQKAVESKTGEFYKPQTRAGRYAESAGEFVPGALVSGPGNLVLKAAKFGIAPGLAAEGAGEATKGTPYEPYARVAAALVAPSAAGVGRKMVTPFEASPRQTEMVDRLADRGVTSLTAGQRTGSPTLQALETKIGNTPGTGYKAEQIANEGEKQFTKAVMSDVGESGMATKPELQTAKERIGTDFNDLSAQNTLKADNRLTMDLIATANRYDQVLDANQKPVFDKLLGNIIDKAIQGGMTGEEYQIARSQLGGKARGLQITDPEAAKAFKGLQKALDANMERGLSPADKVKWRKARDEYGRLKDVEGSVAKEGEQLTEGIVDPATLNRSISGGKDASAAARGQLPFSDIAEAGAGAMQRPGRMMLQNPTPSGVVMSIPNAIAGRLLMSRPGQSYAGNQIITGARAGSPSIAAIVNALREAQK